MKAITGRDITVIFWICRLNIAAAWRRSIRKKRKEPSSGCARSRRSVFFMAVKLGGRLQEQALSIAVKNAVKLIPVLAADRL
jgi:hypothetical protein